MSRLREGITEAEQTFCLFQLGQEGGFITTLIDAILKADRINKVKLALAFPELVEVVSNYQYIDGYWEDLEERWKMANTALPFD